MITISLRQWCRISAFLLFTLAVPAGLRAQIVTSDSPSATELRKLRESKNAVLQNSKFGIPMELTAVESKNSVRGDIYADIDTDFEAVNAALNGPAHWCDILLLHINNRLCSLSVGPPATLVLGIVRKYDQPAEQAFRLALAFRVVQSSKDFLEIELTSPAGPVGTSNYRIVVQAVAMPGKRSFLHFAYSYDSGTFVTMATEAYLATFGRSKVGFTVVGQLAGDQPDYIRGVRGLMERNAMRYFLAIEAYIQESEAPVADQFDRRLEAWFAASERYPRQLHELDKATYLALKHADRSRDSSTKK
ncbi:MAG: hypothetical protein ABIZ09_00480 [Rhodoferax sp.]